MKKLLGLTIGVLISFHSIAQIQTFSWGVMAGVNHSMITRFSDISKFKPGGNFGVFFNQSKHERVGMRAELLYTNMGSAFEGSTNRLQLHYVQVPVYGVWYLNDRGNNYRPKLMAGPYIGGLVGASGSNTPGYGYTPDNFKKIDVGLKVAAGVNFKLNERIWLNSDAYFSQGFYDNFKSEDTKTMINQSYGLNVGVSFPFD